MSAGTTPEPAPPSPTRAAAGRLSIGEVVALLRPEFSDLTDSKIRFLEDRKLISPARTAGGYRSFGPHDIEVLRWILTCQRDRYLPLSIIGERLDRGEHLADIWDVAVTEAPAATAPHEQPPWITAGDAQTYSATELSAESGLTLDEIAELTDFGLLVPLDETDADGSLPLRPSATDNSPPGDDVAPVRSLPAGTEAAPVEAVQASLGLEPPEPRYGSSALLIARISREFATYGLHARHLRVIRNAAARDASMFEQGIQPILHAGGPSADLDAQRSLGRLVALCERLRSAVMGEALRRYWR